MTFKGTKGKCELSKPFDGSILIGGNVRATVLPYSIKGLQEEDKANAVLFSKAPEMLEMLSRVLDCQAQAHTLPSWLNEEIETLVKEATE